MTLEINATGAGCTMTRIEFLPGVNAEHVMSRLAKAGGNEVESGKLGSPGSSAALAVNMFGWFIDCPERLPALPGMEPGARAVAVDIEYCARFPWSGGRHPWLDAVVETSEQLLGIESKRFEPFRDRKTVSLSAAYDRPVWGASMGPYEEMRDKLRSGAVRFEHLDAAQLVKHAFGLVTDGARRSKSPALVYLYAEPAVLGGRPIESIALARHRNEIDRFAEAVRGAAVTFHAISYRDWIGGWSGCGSQVAEHGAAILSHFAP